MSRGTYALIDVAALQHNLQQARQAAPDSKVWAVVKANGYGHGAVNVANALNQADGFAVATLDEAMELQQAGITQPILLLEGCIDPSQLRQAVSQGFALVLHCPQQVQWFTELNGLDAVDVWLKIDTGMHRLGLPPRLGLELSRQIKQAPCTASLGFMTHFACADETDKPMTAQQIEAFQPFVDSGLPCSLANSAGILAWPASHQHWVRAGIMLYGASPFADRSAASLSLKPAMHLNAPVIALHDLEPGDSAGYGARWTANKPTRLATLAIGYGDGYPRHAPDGTPVWINGQRATLAGRVSMDMLTIDITGIDNVELGTEVELWGANIPVDEVAEHVGTIGYELVTRLSARVPLRSR
jgi:alanine racemase